MASNFSKVFSAELDGIEARLVEVETDLHIGLHAFSIVGLADKALSEAKERVSSALKNIGVKPPSKENRKIIVNLAPADLKKTGSQYDLAIAVGYLLATRQLKEFNTTGKIFVGELALDGFLRPIAGALNIAYEAEKLGFEFLFLPTPNAEEAALISGIKIIPVSNLQQLIDHLEEKVLINNQKQTQFSEKENLNLSVSLADVHGQENAKRSLIVAAAGGHNILMSGSPGGGKTMLAQALTSLLPQLSLEEMIAVTKIYSAAGLLRGKPILLRPFRNPHHSASLAAVAGGGTNPRPGEISLAHKGILFLDELPEFRRDVLECLRQPIESKTITVSRVKNNLIFPADFMLVAAMNPCPCGYHNDNQKECSCSANDVLRYRKKISGPLIDRIDIKINVPRVEFKDLQSKKENSDLVKDLKNRISAARDIQHKRQGKLNSNLSSKECERFILLDKKSGQLLENMFKKHLVTARGYYRTLKLSRTIADLEGSDMPTENHLREAFSYRLKD